jgi:hypothetical protein
VDRYRESTYSRIFWTKKLLPRSNFLKQMGAIDKNDHPRTSCRQKHLVQILFKAMEQGNGGYI